MRPRAVRLSVACAALAAAIAATRPGAAQGLAPPPPLDPNSPGAPGGAPTLEQQQTQDTHRRLDEAEQADTGRDFELFWLDAQLGGSYIDMRQFSAETLQIEEASSGGPMFSAAAGLRFVIFVLGARVRHHALAAFNMWQIGAEAGLKIPIQKFDLLFGLHGGYSTVGRLGDAALSSTTNTSADEVAVRGFNVGMDLAFDYYVSPMFSVGAGLLGDVLVLNRPLVERPSNFAELSPAEQQAINEDPLYNRTGASVGLTLAAGLRLGLHFGL